MVFICVVLGLTASIFYNTELTYAIVNVPPLKFPNTEVLLLQANTLPLVLK